MMSMPRLPLVGMVLTEVPDGVECGGVRKCGSECGMCVAHECVCMGVSPTQTHPLIESPQRMSTGMVVVRERRTG